MVEIISFDKLRGRWTNDICPLCPKQQDGSCPSGADACIAVEMLRQLAKASPEDRQEWLDNVADMIET
ncbi:hypothetical protein [Paenibacillus sp. FSL R5-0908]|jgi:hypothetical protein|uniref:hypothetical protein n=1 Tax=Paenibacillus sp. FSL R5-0908 TaxID=2921664 RepID=UPI0030F54DC1